jgi:hypothetical protein
MSILSNRRYMVAVSCLLVMAVGVTLLGVGAGLGIPIATIFGILCVGISCVGYMFARMA